MYTEKHNPRKPTKADFSRSYVDKQLESDCVYLVTNINSVEQFSKISEMNFRLFLYLRFLSHL